MSTLTPPPRIVDNGVDFRERWSEERLTVLWAITCWYNGIPITNDGRTYHLGRDPPPKLQTLIGCSDAEWEHSYRPVLRDFQRKELVTERTIFRRKIRWEPKRKLRRILGELFSDHIEGRGLHDSINEGTKLIGDWNETIPHRTGVEHVRTIQRARGCHVRCYPGKQNEVRPDVLWYAGPIYPTGLETKGTYNKGAAEVISPHHDRGMLIRKYEAFAADDSKEYLWVFATRKHAARVLNYLHISNETACSIVNAPFHNPENYAIETLNDYIERSSNSPFSCEGIDKIATLTSLHDQIAEKHSTLRWNTPPSDRNRIVVG